METHQKRASEARHRSNCSSPTAVEKQKPYREVKSGDPCKETLTARHSGQALSYHKPQKQLQIWGRQCFLQVMGHQSTGVKFRQAV